MAFNKQSSSSPSSANETANDSSEAAGPIAGRRETLAARAQRFIGKVLETEPTSTSDSSKRGPPKKAPTKRREQVLQAQRNHRQRTQGYIRELEKEVLRLRERENELVDESQALHDQVKLLKQMLASNSIQLPYEFWSFETEGDMQSSGTSRETTAEPTVTIDLTDLSRVEASKWCGITAAVEIPPPYVEPPSKAIKSFRTTVTAPGGVAKITSPSSRIISTALSAQSAVDFVLELEKPCLPHVKYRYMTGYTPPSCATVDPESHAGPGHVFTATATLVNDYCDEQPPERPFAVSPEEIDRLFRTSLSLELGPDCTPIQIWANLIRISTRHAINNLMLRVLIDEFMKYIRCNSFGAVVERSTASAILSYFFPGEEFVSDWPLP